MNELSKETIGIKQLFFRLKEGIKTDYQIGKLTEHRLIEISCLIDLALCESLMPGNTIDLLELKDAITFGNRLRLLLSEKLYNEPISDDWKTKLEDCLNTDFIC